MCKNQQRKTIREIKNNFSETELRELSIKILKHLEDNIFFQFSKTVILYYSLPDEVYTHHFIDKWYSKKTILLPKINGEQLTLHPYNNKKNMHIGPMNIMEPDTELYNDYPSIDLAIVPGMAFDMKGNRLGRGKGYYDRLLSQRNLKNVYKIGIAFPFQILENVTHSPQDIIMDEVIV